MMISIAISIIGMVSISLTQHTYSWDLFHVVAKKNYIFREYSEVSVEFQLEDIFGNLLPLNFGNLLPLNLCQVYECGVHLLDAKDKDEICRFALTMADYTSCPLDRDELEARFQAKRAWFQA